MSRTFLENVQAAQPIRDLALTLSESCQSREPGGHTLCLSTLQGNLIVLLVLGVDCSSCRHVAGVLSGLRKEYSSLEVVGTCVQTGCQEKLPDFAKSTDVQFPLGYCPTRELCAAIGIPASMWLFYPTLIFVDQRQRLRAVFVGKHDFFHDPATNIRAVLDQLIRETSQQVRQTEVTA
jgi:hypothetical protein